MSNFLNFGCPTIEKEENHNVGACGGFLVDNDLLPVHCGGRLPSLKEIVWKLGLRQIFKNYYKNHISMNLISDDNNINKKIEYITGADIFFRKDEMITLL